MSRWHLYAEFDNGVNSGGAISIRLVIRDHRCFCSAAGLYQFYEPEYGQV